MRFAIVCSAILISIFFISSCAPIPSDVEMMRMYREKKGDFAKAVEMTRSDQFYGRINSDKIRYNSWGIKSLSVNRISLYRSAIKSLRPVDQIGSDSDSVLFFVYDRGYGGDVESKAILWSRVVPGKIYNNLDDIRKKKIGPISAWRKIDDNWYIEYDSD